MRVLMNTYPVAFDCPGGGEIQLLQSRAALERAGVRVDLFDPWKPQFDDADIVHYFSVQGGSMNFCGHVKRRGLPLVISPILWLTPEGLPNYPVPEIRGLFRMCDRILPNSEAEADQLSSFFEIDREKFSVTTNAVGREFSVPGDPERFRKHAGIPGPFLLNVANVEPRKNQLVLIRSLRDFDTPLVLMGRLRDADYAETCRREGGDRVKWIGPLEHGGELQRSAYRACEVFVLPSLLETPGLAALEAAAQGAKVAITRVGSTREYFGEGASYLDPGDESSIRQAILEERQRPSSPALRERILQQFTWDATARQLISAYEQTLASKKAGLS